MKLDVRIFPSNRMRADADLILLAERLGFAAAWVAEQAHNPFFSLTIAAKETSMIELGAYRAAAFPRSPMVTAQIAWDLARQSSGRFCLALDTQSGSPNEPYDGASRMREYIESLRAIWHTFQTDERLRYRGKYYTFRLMAPFFNPGPIEHPDIPIYLSGVDPSVAELAGTHCQGLHTSAIHSADYLRNIVKPSVSTGLLAAGRAEDDCSLVVPVLIASGTDDSGIRQARRTLKLRIVSAAKTAAFRQVMAHHNWEFSVDKVDQPTREYQLDGLDQVIPDEIVDEIAIVAPPHKVLELIKQRYSGIAERVSLDLSGENVELIEAIMVCS